MTGVESVCPHPLEPEENLTGTISDAALVNAAGTADRQPRLSVVVPDRGGILYRTGLLDRLADEFPALVARGQGIEAQAL